MKTLTLELDQWNESDVRRFLRQAIPYADTGEVRSFLLSALEQTYEPLSVPVPVTTTPLDRGVILELLHQNKKIEAIKYVRDNRGLSLWEAKMLVEGVAWNDTKDSA